MSSFQSVLIKGVPAVLFIEVSSFQGVLIRGVPAVLFIEVSSFQGVLINCSTISYNLCKIGSEKTTIQDQNILDNSNLFVWDGKQVDGEFIQTGKSCEPVLLRVTYPTIEEEAEVARAEEGGRESVVEIGRPKDSTLGDLRVMDE